MAKLVLTLGCAAALLLACAEAPAAAQGGAAPGTPPPPAAKPKTAEDEGVKPEEGQAAKPEEASPSTGTEGAATPSPEGDNAPLSLGELTRDGFEIRATDFIPAEAVTRQSGKVTSDAVIVTLQKTSSTAVCFYTLKAYVGKTLATIPACTVHR